MVIYTGTSGSSERSGTLERSISSAPGSHVNRIHTQDRGKGSSTQGICGPRHERSFGWWDPSGSCLRTYQASFLEMTDGRVTGSQFLESFPSWGLMLGGEFIAQPTPGHPISGNGGGSWPTPNTSDSHGANMKDGHDLTKGYLRGVVQIMTIENVRNRLEQTGYHFNLEESVAMDALPAVQGSLNPDWVEQHLMSLPEGGTRLEPVPDGAYDEWFDAMRDGTWWDTERGLPRVTTGAENRVNRLKMLGNGIVPATLALFLIDD